jgi:hypothetical protein
MKSVRVKLLRILPTAAAYVLTVLWLASGLAKLIALDTFKVVLLNHGVLSDRAIDLAWIVPGIETALGLAIIVAHAGRGLPALRRVCAAVSVVLLVVFCFYIARVPEEIFRTVGCGCQGAFGLTDLTGSPSRAAAIGVNGVFVLMSIALWFSPVRSAPASPEPAP